MGEITLDCHNFCGVKVASSSWVKIRLRTKNQLTWLPGSALKVYVVGFGVMVWCLVANQ
jgi:hypothetical protein